MGDIPGLVTKIVQSEPASVMNPPNNIGINPQYINEDLPLPEAPITAVNLCWARFSNTSSLCPSLPKKR